MHTGKVKWFNEYKGFGFIQLEDGREVFMHYSNILMTGFKTLKQHDLVEFDLYETDNGLMARNIKKI